ncbi:MAG TPA: PA0069 family radical SAM protein [Thermoanaerobaculia bacterium]|nr:PA0069 family radical SAM protein [Thermoanaerobaculia bacterium]
MSRRRRGPESLPPAPRGRGAAGSPRNRFERLDSELDLDTLDDELAERVEGERPSVATEILRDGTRTILARNDSPDLGFDTSINPYRGCEHGCVYCLGGDTPILLADGRTRDLADLRTGDEIYGTERRGFSRRYVTTRVLDHWQVRKPAYRLALEDGTELIAAENHRFLTERGWKFVARNTSGGQRPHLTTNDRMMGTGRFDRGPDPNDPEYRRGYLTGLIRGDGHLPSHGCHRPHRAHGGQHQLGLALVDTEALDRAAAYSRGAGIEVGSFELQREPGTKQAIQAIRRSSRSNVDAIRTLVEWPSHPAHSWQRGFLAGIFDAQGSYSEGVLRITHACARGTDQAIVDAVCDALRGLGFRWAEDRGSPDGLRPKRARAPVAALRLLGGLVEVLRFFHQVGNAISRKRDIAELALRSSARLRVAEIEPLQRSLQLFDITTGTGDFIANGVVSHNCYARPTHEYLGFSAGLDFETKILVKEGAPALLRRELESPRYRPRVIALSGVTDPYQPLERRLRITRGCLEVLAEKRNPVVIVTKNRLVARDADLLGELARHDAAHVMLSVTTLDVELARRMEPRTSSPPNRLRAIAEMRAAGVPCGVLVAPVIPALNDHEIPHILEAAKAAGAVNAGWVLLRLPHGVKELFDDWLQRHYPERRDKVLGRLREARDGALYRAEFFRRQRGTGAYAEQIAALFELHRRRLGLAERGAGLSVAAFRRGGEKQLSLLG